MNWYKITKLGAIWDTDWDSGDEDFLNLLTAVYELEYKHSVLTNNPFAGSPKRKENISKAIDERLWDVLDAIKQILIEVFRMWLSEHALTDPEQWATSRMTLLEEYYDERDSGTHLTNLIDEFIRYRPGGHMGSAFYIMMLEITDNIEAYPTVQQVAVLLAEDRKQMMLEELASSGFEEFGSYHGQDFQTEEEAEKFIYQNIGNIDDFLYEMVNDDLDNFSGILYKTGLLEQFTHEVYKNLVFPMWYEHWREQGIDETRETVQNIYEKLESVEGLGNTISIINLAINTSHQTGGMSDYIEQYGNMYISGDIVSHLNTLTQGDMIEEWNEELREIGVQI